MLKKSEDVILLFGRSIIGLYFLLPGAVAKMFNYDFNIIELDNNLNNYLFFVERYNNTYFP